MIRTIARSMALAALAVAAAWGQSLTVSCLPATLPQLVGTAVSVKCTVSGGATPYIWSIGTGTLPPGLLQDTGTGAITGTLKDSAGSYSFTVVATDSTPVTPLTGSQSYLGTTVDPLTVTCKLATGPLEVGIAYSNPCTAAGGTQPYTWSIGGQSIPAGLVVSAAGTVSDTPASSSASYQYSVVATDNTGPTPLSQSQQFTGAIAPAVTIGTPLTLPAAAVGSSYSQQLAVSSGTGVKPFVWSATGLTNTGLSLTTAGLLSGIPTTAGPLSIMATVTDSAGGTSSGGFSLTVTPALVISPVSPLPAATVGAAYSQKFTATGGSGSGYTWSVNGQPSWLSMSAAGTLSSAGPAPASAVTSAFTVSVADSNNNSISGSFTLPVTLAITTASLSPATIGTPYSQTLAAVGGAGGYTWSVTTGATLPAWLQLSTAGKLTGTPPATAVDVSLSVTATDSSNASVSATVALPVNAAITTSGLANGAIGDGYNQTVAGEGGLPPYSWTVTTGASSLPPGLQLNAGTGVISGLPTQAGQFQFTIQLSDSASPPVTVKKQFAITVSNALSISTGAALPNAVSGAAYSQTLTAAGGVPPYTWSPTGALPGALAALSLSANGAIVGTPTTTGAGSFTATVTDSAGGTSKQTFTLAIVFTITTASPLPSGEVNISYSQTLAASGGAQPYTWSVTGGNPPPPGLTLSPASGLLSGTPNTSGAYTFTVRATDGNNITVSTALTVTIAEAVAISTPSTLAGGSVNSSYSQTLAASAGISPYTWTLTMGPLPPGLGFSTTGVISGTPAAAGTFPFTVTVTDSVGGKASRLFTIVVVQGLTVTTAPTLPGASVGVQYSDFLQATGGSAPYTWINTTGFLPPGLSLKTNGDLFGFPTTVGSYSFTVQVTDSLGHQASAVLAITVAPVLIITTSALPGGTVGGAYSQSLAATGGTPPYTWSVASGSLPQGLTLSPAGSIAGTASTAGTFSFTVLVTDSAAVTVTKQFSITIAGGISITTAATLPNAPLNSTYSETLAAAGGTPPYTWAVTAGALPNGLTVSTGGVISGTPTAAGTFQFTVTVTDSASSAASQQFTLIAGGGLAITTTALPGGTVGAPYSEAFTATGGTPPYTFAVSVGKLPPGLALSGAVLSGTPTQAGSDTFTIQVTDSASATATEQFTIAITGLAITTSALPNAAVGAPYSWTMAAAGGTPPYTWALAAGALPAGLVLSASSGTISGTPQSAGTASVTIQVTDSAKVTTSEPFTLTVLASPTASFTGLSSAASSAQQLSFALAPGAAYPQEITGQVALAFQPDASLASPANDPAIQFSSGGTTASFTIPANSTTPVSFSLQTGTVAGTITLTVSWQAGGVTLATPAALTQTIQIAPAVPVISAVSAAATSSGFQVLVTAFSNTRELSQAVLQFTPASGQTLQTTSLTVSLTSAATTWFQSTTSDAYGSQFVLTLPFTVTNGSASAIGSVSVQLVNSQGSSTAASGTL